MCPIYYSKRIWIIYVLKCCHSIWGPLKIDFFYTIQWNMLNIFWIILTSSEYGSELMDIFSDVENCNYLILYWYKFGVCRIIWKRRIRVQDQWNVCLDQLNRQRGMKWGGLSWVRVNQWKQCKCVMIKTNHVGSNILHAFHKIPKVTV